jgi:hypothetical protein
MRGRSQLSNGCPQNHSLPHINRFVLNVKRVPDSGFLTKYLKLDGQVIRLPLLYFGVEESVSRLPRTFYPLSDSEIYSWRWKDSSDVKQDA